MFLMVVTAVDVVGRYLLNSPLHGGFELTQMGLATVVFGGLPLVTWRSEQITLDVLERHYQGALRTIKQHIVLGLSFAVLAAVSWRIFIHAGKTMAAGTTTIALKIPLYPLLYFLAAMAALSALIVGLQWLSVLRSRAQH